MKLLYAVGVLLLATFAISTGAYADGGTPGVITVTGQIYKQTNPQGQCGASLYGYVFLGTYTNKNGKQVEISDCVDSIAVPFEFSCDEDAGLSSDYMKSALNDLSRLAGKQNVKYVVSVDDITNPIGIGTLLGYQTDCK